MNGNKIIIGSRGSDLALWQANYISGRLAESGCETEISIIKTKGDDVKLSFDKMEGKGFFTREIEGALLGGKIDLAVHSFKDLETVRPAGLKIAAVTERANPADILLARRECIRPGAFLSLEKGAVVGTSSARRKSQMRAFMPDVQLKDLRGNVPTRIRKLREGQYDAILLAAAGVERLELDLSDLHIELLPCERFIPAPAQGALALETRSNDEETQRAVSFLNDEETRNIVEVEREVLRLFDGGCQLPLGAFCTYNEDEETYLLRISMAKAWDSLPVMVNAISSNPAGLAEKAVKKCRQIVPSSVFITRDLHGKSLFRRVLTAHGFSVSGKALIEFQPTPVRELSESDWIFFSSKHAVRYFFESYRPAAGVKYGVIGKGTAEALRKNGKRADFIGHSTDTRLTGKQFAAVAGRSRVLFPQAAGSMRTVQQQMIDSDKVEDLNVYKTIRREIAFLPSPDIVVFTSPSNVEAWFAEKKWSENQRAVAMGKATAKALAQHGVLHIALTDSFDETGLLRAVFGLKQNDKTQKK